MNNVALRGLIATPRKRSKELEPHLAEADHMQIRLEEARRRGYLTKQELLEVCRDKSPRRAEMAKANSDDDVVVITKSSFGLVREDVRIAALCALKGVQVPTASCILSWTYPDRWGVIDRRAWKSLFQADVVNRRSEGTSLGPNEWSDYCEAVNAIASALSVTPQRADRLLYCHDRYPQST